MTQLPPAWSRPESHMVHISEQIGAIRTGDYSRRPPSPPHLHVPQSAEDAPIVLPLYNGVGSEPGEYIDVLRLITQSCRTVRPIKNWKYELRRQAQPILSFLYLGPSAAARDVAYLRSEGITLLLVIRDTMTAQARLLNADKVAQQLGIQSLAIDVDGSPQLIAAFPQAIKIINDHIVSNYRRAQLTTGATTPDPLMSCGKVLVFCESGNERSAAVVAAYLQNTYGLNLVSAVQYLQSQRFCISLDDNLKNLLLSYSEILTAHRAVAGARNGPMRRSKRGRNVDGDDDEVMDTGQVDDHARFEDRETFVPFK